MGNKSDKIQANSVSDRIRVAMLAELENISATSGVGLATEATLAALLAKVIAAPSTEAKQDAIIALLIAIDADTSKLDVALSTRNAEATQALVKTAVEGINVKLTAVSRTSTFVRKTDTTGSPIAAGKRSVSVANVGVANGVWMGAVIKPGEAFDFSAGGEEDTLDSYSYDGTGTELVITTIT